MSQITTHILDITRGTPAQGVSISLFFYQGNSWIKVAGGVTDNDGRITDLCAEEKTLSEGTYKITFETAAYFKAKGDTIFYPWADVVFNIAGDTQHYHIPLLLSAFGYSTYRGS